jgi:hypothetical protein
MVSADCFAERQEGMRTRLRVLGQGFLVVVLAVGFVPQAVDNVTVTCGCGRNQP